MDALLLTDNLSNNNEDGLRQNIAYIDKKTSETKGFRLGDAIDLKYPLLCTVVGVTGHLLISSIPSFVYLDLCERYSIDNNLNIKGTDNPIISIYRTIVKN